MWKTSLRLTKIVGRLLRREIFRWRRKLHIVKRAAKKRLGKIQCIVQYCVRKFYEVFQVRSSKRLFSTDTVNLFVSRIIRINILERIFEKVANRFINSSRTSVEK